MAPLVESIRIGKTKAAGLDYGYIVDGIEGIAGLIHLRGVMLFSLSHAGPHSYIEPGLCR